MVVSGINKSHSLSSAFIGCAYSGGMMTKGTFRLGTGILALCATAALNVVSAKAQDAAAEPALKGKIADAADQSVPSWPKQKKAPAGAPNIVLILLDDVGFGGSSTFGGPAQTPALERLAKAGIRYNRFHTTGICSPTRAALLTGRNAHQVGFGTFADVPAGYPGYDAHWGYDTASIAAILKDNGYNTAAFGKWHNTAPWEISPAGPFERWPTGLGFEYFYGFMFGETSEWEPRLYRGVDPVEHLHHPDYHLNTDLANDAVKWIHRQKAVAPDKPFFIYFAPGAIHAPLHVPQEYIDKYRGMFDLGWDKLREKTFARQKKLGVIPASAQLTPRPEQIPAWDSLLPDEKRLYARQMEIYAAYLEQTDYEVGRVLKDIDASGLSDNTLVLYVVGDNGASGEGGLQGSDISFAEIAGGATRTVGEQLKHIDELGSQLRDNHVAAGWAWAADTPFQWVKQVASHFGATRNGFVVSWPGRTAQPGAIRSQFSHVIDVAPTILAATGIPVPDKVNGIKQVPFAGRSLLQTFTKPGASEVRNIQYFEANGQRAIYKDGWFASAMHYVPWEAFADRSIIYNRSLDEDKWELYHIDRDFSQAMDLAERYPGKIAELKAAFNKEARDNSVYPLLPPPFVGAPLAIPENKTHFTFLSGADRLPQASVPSVSGRSHKLTATITVPKNGAQGVIVAEGGRYGGWSLYVQDGKLNYANNTMNIVHETLTSSEPLPAGRLIVSVVFTAQRLGSGGDVKISPLRGGPPCPGFAEMFVGGKKVAEVQFSKFGGFASSITETFDVGSDTGSTVTQAYAGPFPFTGSIQKIEIDLQ